MLHNQLKWTSNDRAQCPIVPYAASVARGSKYDRSFIAVKRPTMSICSYFKVKQRDLPELETVVSSFVAEAVRTEVKRTIGVKHATDEEGNSSGSKRSDDNRYIILQI